MFCVWPEGPEKLPYVLVWCLKDMVSEKVLKKAQSFGQLLLHCIHTAGLYFDTDASSDPLSFIVLGRILSMQIGIRGSGWLASHVFIFASRLKKRTAAW